MKFLNSKNYIFLLSMVFIFVMSSCTNDDIATGPDGEVDFTTFGVNFEKDGALITIGDVVTGFYNLSDLANASVGFKIDAVGAPVTSANLNVSLNGQTAQLQTVSGLPATVSVPFTQVLSALSLSASSVNVGDVVTFSLSDVSTGGGTFRSGTTLDAPLSCVSDIGGSFSGVTVGKSTDGCCPDETTVTQNITLTDNGGGKYSISDWSGGLYLEWYDVYGITPQTDMTAVIEDVCGTLAGSFTEPFGTATTITGSVDPSTGIITLSWITGYDDVGTLELTPN